MLSAMMTPRNAINAQKEMMAATQLLSVPLLAVSHTESATQVLESALHATQKLTRTAPKLNQLVTKNVSSNLFQNVELMENAQSAKKDQLHLDVSQLLVVKRPAHHTHHHTLQPTNANITQPNQPALLMRLDPRPRLSANNNAKSQHLLNATSRTTLARSATTIRTKIASKLQLIARLNNKREDARPKN